MEFVPYKGQAISNSCLASIKRELLGQPDFFGDEKYLILGAELHKRLFEPLETKLSLDTDQEELLLELYTHLYKHPLIEFSPGDENEINAYGKILSIPFHGYIDKRRGESGVDLKTSSVTTLKAFIKTASKYGYWRQAYIYKKVAKLKNFYFVVASKKPPYRIFEINVDDYPNEMRAAKQETIFLIKMIHHYGIPKRYIARSIKPNL